MSIRTLIVDDEPWARTRLASLLRDEADFTIVQSAASAAEAIDAIGALAPDVVFLDVQMPEQNGFAVIDAIGVDAMPLVVFATAYEQHAVRAFDAQALDYLLKPFDEERFARTLDRVRYELSDLQGARASLQQLMQARQGARRYLQRVAVSSAGRVLFVKTAEIDWMESEGNYVMLHVGPKRHLLRESLSAMADKLDPQQFVRLHRCAIVNVERIRELSPWSRGEQAIVLQDGTQLTIGRTFRPQLMAVLANAMS
jgi:two-component system, LytTR family, response regulator